MSGFFFKLTDLETFWVIVRGNDYDKRVSYVNELADALKQVIPFEFSVHAEPVMYTAANQEKGLKKDLCVLMIIVPKTISSQEAADMLREKGFVEGPVDFIV